MPQFSEMQTQFLRADPARELRGLLAFDRVVFGPSDRFTRDYWMEVIPYWLLIGGVKAGCCAFERHMDFQAPLKHSLYIATTGIHPRFRSLGFGALMKAWQICYAKRSGFHRIVTNVRSKNAAIIALNEKFGFRTIQKLPGYYSGPADATLVMELNLHR